jgi:multisubunit Na+/H+ antiporter MnhC subunit
MYILFISKKFIHLVVALSFLFCSVIVLIFSIFIHKESLPYIPEVPEKIITVYDPMTLFLGIVVTIIALVFGFLGLIISRKVTLYGKDGLIIPQYFSMSSKLDTEINTKQITTKKQSYKSDSNRQER